MKLWLLVCFSIVSATYANHINCTTLDCSDLCNFHGSWVNTTSTNGVDHGICVCNDDYYTLDSDLEHDHDLTYTNHHPEAVYCTHRRKLQGFAFLLHVLFGWIGAGHFYLRHAGLGIAQLILFAFFCAGMRILVEHNNNSSLDAQTKFNYVMLVLLFTLPWTLWYILDYPLFLSGHYKDVHGQDLIPL